MKRLILSVCLYAAVLLPAWANPDMFNAETRKALQAINGSLSKPSPSADTAPPAAADAGIGAYQPSPEVSHKVREDLIGHLLQLGRSHGMDDASAEQLAQNLRQVDVPAKVWPVLTDMGYPRDNQITALCYWLLANWDVIQGRNSTPEEIQAVYRQMIDNYARVAELSNGTHADKQYISEAMIWLATMQGEIHLEAQKSGDAAKIEEARQGATQALLQLGFDPSQMRMTAQGLQPK